MSQDLKIYRKGFQTWNNDFLQWLDSFEIGTFSGADVINTDYFAGSISIYDSIGGYYKVIGIVSNIEIVDTSSDTSLSIEVIDLSSIFGTNIFEASTAVTGVVDVTGETYNATMVPLQFLEDTSALYVSPGLYVPIHHTWYIDLDINPSSSVDSFMLSKRVKHNLIRKAQHGSQPARLEQ